MPPEHASDGQRAPCHGLVGRPGTGDQTATRCCSASPEAVDRSSSADESRPHGGAVPHRRAMRKPSGRRHTLVVTLEPCVMCAGAAVLARLDRIVYGAADLKAGAAWSLYNIPQDRRLNHRVELVDGVLEEECSALLSDFFTTRR